MCNDGDALSKVIDILRRSHADLLEEDEDDEEEELRDIALNLCFVLATSASGRKVHDELDFSLLCS